MNNKTGIGAASFTGWMWANPSGAAQQEAAQGLRLLAIYRVATPLFQAVTFFFVAAQFNLGVPLGPVAVMLALEVLVAIATLIRLRSGPKVTAQELLLHAILDISLFTAMLYYTGGSTNPFAPLYVVPVMIVAMALPPRWVWFAATFTVACYAFLRDHHVPLSHPRGDAEIYELHEDGMVVNYVLTAAMLVFFSNRMSVSLGRQSRLAAEAQEAQMRSEAVAAIGALAANSAHELGSPLAAVAVIAAELEREYPADKRLQRDLHLIADQVLACKRILVKMADAGSERRAETASGARLDQFIRATIERLQALNPGVTILAHLDRVTPAPCIVVEETLRHAIANLIQNAINASPQYVEVLAGWTGADLEVIVLDQGPGFNKQALHTLGKAVTPARPSKHGLGLGLLLSAETLKRLGGSLDMANRAGGGAQVRLRVPLATLLIDKKRDAADAAPAD